MSHAGNTAKSLWATRAAADEPVNSPGAAVSLLEADLERARAQLRSLKRSRRKAMAVSIVAVIIAIMAIAGGIMGFDSSVRSRRQATAEAKSAQEIRRENDRLLQQQKKLAITAALAEAENMRLRFRSNLGNLRQERLHFFDAAKTQQMLSEAEAILGQVKEWRLKNGNVDPALATLLQSLEKSLKANAITK